MFAGAEEMK